MPLKFEQAKWVFGPQKYGVKHQNYLPAMNYEGVVGILRIW